MCKPKHTFQKGVSQNISQSVNRPSICQTKTTIIYLQNYSRDDGNIVECRDDEMYEPTGGDRRMGRL